jgi:putative RecB family exonuclease
MEVGTFQHKVDELLLERPKEYRTIAAARHHARWLRVAPDGLWGDSARPTSVQRGEITEADFMRQSWHAITGLWEIQDPATLDVLATEERIDWMEGDVPMQVVIDLVTWEAKGAGLNPGMIVNDFKSGRVPKKRHQGTHKRQITVGPWPSPPERARWRWLALERSCTWAQRLRWSISAPTDRKARAAVSEAAQQVWADINAACKPRSSRPPRPPLCAYCSHVKDCPEGQSYIRASQSWRSYNPDAPGSRVVAALDAA